MVEWLLNVTHFNGTHGEISKEGRGMLCWHNDLYKTKLSFEIIKSVNLCIRGSRTPVYKNNESDFLFDFTLNSNSANTI